MTAFRTILQILLPIAVLAGGIGGAYLVVTNSKKPIVEAPENLGPLVRVHVVAPSDERLDVLARGTVEPLRTVELAAEVSGRIVGTDPALRAGGTFTPNDVLVEIDPTDYRLAIHQQESAVARAELRLLQEEAEAESAVRAWKQLEGDRPADPLVRREPQIKDATLAVEAAKAQLERARTDLLRCKVQLPFAGRVRSVHADIGQTVQRGQRLAVVLDTGELEVRLPIPLHDAGFVDLPLAGSTDDGPKVELSAEFAGRRRSWPGRIVRIEGELDRKTRQLTAVARVRATGDNPLLVGMFVDATIRGRLAEQVFAVPRAAVFQGDQVWLVTERTDDDGVKSRHLERRTVEVLRAERDRVLVQTGLVAGDRVCVTSMQAPVDGMKVRVDEDVTEPQEQNR
jgi:RND family efflux transporter MFP subunit